MGKIYAHTDYRLRMKTSLDLTAASSLQIEAWNPANVSSLFTGFQDPTYADRIYHDFTVAENDSHGEWRFQPVITDSTGKQTRGETQSMTIHQKGT